MKCLKCGKKIKELGWNANGTILWNCVYCGFCWYIEIKPEMPSYYSRFTGDKLRHVPIGCMLIASSEEMNEVKSVDITQQVCGLLGKCRQMENTLIRLQGEYKQVKDYTSIQQPQRDINSLAMAQKHLGNVIRRLGEMLG